MRRPGLLLVLVASTWAGGPRVEARDDPRPAPGASRPRTPRPWPDPIPAPPGLEGRPGPWSDPDDPTAWPNRESRANSDPWIAEHHDQIRVMRPRVLLVNFSNEHTPAQLRALADRIIAALQESTRFRGYRDPKAPAFLRYEVFKFVDLRDPDRRTGNARRAPVLDPRRKSGRNLSYRAFFSDEFARHYDVPDPRDPGRRLRLDELVDGGYVHEVWFFDSGAVDVEPTLGALEVVEEKPAYDERFRKVEGRFVQAGNGGDDDQPWTGRSVRIGCINASRGPGCFLESLAHGLEGTATSGAIPYFSRYFKEYAGLDLDRRYGLPFSSLYAVDYGRSAIQYPDPGTMVVTHGGKRLEVKDYVAAGGNAHFPPNARGHYDLENDRPVLSTIESWRSVGAGKGRPWTVAAFAKYRELAPDCMGPWLVYWRQNMPGLDNDQRDDHGRPLKNWWPFLFY